MTPIAKARLVGAAARITGYRLGERLGRTGPLGVADVPCSPADLTPAWLTSALCGRHAGAEVLDFEIGAGSDGTSARRPLRVRYNEAGTAAGLPTALYTKSAPDLMTRLFCGLNNLMGLETEFYLRIRPELDIESPVGFHGVYHRPSGRSLLILEDIVASRGATFGDPTVTYVDRANAERMVELMATYHGTFWADPRLDGEFGWLMRSEDFQRRLNDMMGFRRMFHNGLRRSRELMPRPVVAAEGRMWAALNASLELRARAVPTLLHQDVHARNWYFTGDGRIGLYDWQACAKGLWALDVAYALSCGLTVEDRRAWERDLLGIYLDRLAAAGGKAPTFEAAWLAYRQQMVHGLAFWLATIGVTRLQPQLQPRPVCVANIERMSQAVADLETLKAVSG
jgi:Phosphotransferase enzyme family